MIAHRSGRREGRGFSGGVAGQRSPTAVIVEDRRLMADALSSALRDCGIAYVSVATHREGLMRALDGLFPDVVLVDLAIRTDDGLALARDSLCLFPNAKVIVLASAKDEETTQLVLREGFHVCITPDMSATDFLQVVRAALAGKALIPFASKHQTGVPVHGEEMLARQLTLREREVLALMAEGLSSTQIARRLWISLHTVRTHVQGILSKLQVHSRLEATAFAVRHGMVRPGSPVISTTALQDRRDARRSS